ncbi:MAG TPA: AcrB/AcrD/AcrF family protein, partial [Oceanicaulis sp.]|nr:AcrB/AcrD/AcrF family protein [Oceanicaulis sp.]
MTEEHDNEKPRGGILAWWAGNSIAANLLMIIALVGGIIGYSQIQRDENPAASFAGATVSVSWPGASPQEVEEQIILRIEEAMTAVDGVRRITATAVEGSGWVNIEGNSTVDPAEFLDAVKLQVDSINNFPVEAFQPRVTEWQSRSQIAGIAVHGNIDRRELQRIAREMRNEISAAIPEVAAVNIQARLPEEVSIEISEENMRRYGITIAELSRAISTSSLNLSAGSVRTDLGDVRVAARQLADTAEEFGNIIVRQTPGGSVIRVRDVATVIDGLEDRPFEATFNGEPMVLLTLMSVGNSDVIDVSGSLAAYIDRKQRELPTT